MPLRAPPLLKRSAVPKHHCGGDVLPESCCVPTADMDWYVGPGVNVPKLYVFACSCPMKTLVACIRVLLPKPCAGAVRRFDSSCRRQAGE